MKVGDLKNQTSTPGPHPILYCDGCGSEYSANAGDYFSLGHNESLTCCHEPLRLVLKKIVLEDVTP